MIGCWKSTAAYIGKPRNIREYWFRYKLKIHPGTHQYYMLHHVDCSWGFGKLRACCDLSACAVCLFLVGFLLVVGNKS